MFEIFVIVLNIIVTLVHLNGFYTHVNAFTVRKKMPSMIASTTLLYEKKPHTYTSEVNNLSRDVPTVIKLVRGIILKLIVFLVHLNAFCTHLNILNRKKNATNFVFQ